MEEDAEQSLARRWDEEADEHMFPPHQYDVCTDSSGSKLAIKADEIQDKKAELHELRLRRLEVPPAPSNQPLTAAGAEARTAAQRG